MLNVVACLCNAVLGQVLLSVAFLMLAVLFGSVYYIER